MSRPSALFTCVILRSTHPGGKKRMRTTVTGLFATRLLLILVMLTLGAAQEVSGQPVPSGEAVMAWPITIAPTWFDPSTAPPQITPFGILYALHDALVRPLSRPRGMRRPCGSSSPINPKSPWHDRRGIVPVAGPRAGSR